MSKAGSFKDMKVKWYKLLEKDGFEDIEDTSIPTYPLKEFHSQKATSKRYTRIRETREEYQRVIDAFTYHKTFVDACKFVVSHGNCGYSEYQAKEVWSLHVAGYSPRKIAKIMKRSHDSVVRLLQRFRDWIIYIGRN